MAYPFYQTNPYSFFPTQPAQSTQQPVQNNQQFQPVMYSSGIIWVNGEAEASMYPIAPNNAVALWETSGKRAYMKNADATGKPTMTIYDLVEREKPEYDNSSGGETKSSYATKEELGAVVAAVKGFDELIGSIKADIDTMRGDMYGIAGKKKLAKKQTEALEDDE